MKARPALDLILIVLFLSGCSGAVTPGTALPVTLPTPPSETPAPSAIPTATALRTPPALPAAFVTSLLNPLDTPHAYLQDTCQYLRQKWSSRNSAPGTVVMVLMFHSITEGVVTNSNQTSLADFRTLMQALIDNGFQAITTAQLAGFLEQNAKIPPRSVLLVADDRHTRKFFDDNFHQYWEKYGWPVVNAWISTPLSSADLWQQQVDLEKEGWVDHQAHGVVHNTPMGPHASDAYITSELQGSIDAFQKYFGKSPIAIIWPGGEFSQRSVEIARQLGYRLGFTATPRGPLMFNWIPLADASDPKRPSWAPEGAMHDPLMVLPRYWDTDALRHMSTVIQIGQDAAAYAAANKATELEYYDILCASAYGPLP